MFGTARSLAAGITGGLNNPGDPVELEAKQYGPVVHLPAFTSPNMGGGDHWPAVWCLALWGWCWVRSEGSWTGPMTVQAATDRVVDW